MKYVAMIKWIEDESNPTAYTGSGVSNLTVDDQKVVFTGLIDTNENPICRVQTPIGFGRDEEW